MMKLTGVIIVLLYYSQIVSGQYENLTYKFDFGSERVGKEYIGVDETSIYTDAKGFGFDFNTTAHVVKRKGKNIVINDMCTSTHPFYFSIAVPDGNYQIKVVLGDKEEATSTFIKAEARRFIDQVNTEKGKFKEITFNVNVRTPLLPSGDVVRLKKRERNGHPSWDNKLTLEFNGEKPTVCAIEVKRVGDVKTIYICGDSTVTDQKSEPWSGWGMMLPFFFDENICVANYAESGETLKAFRGERRLEKIMSVIQPGDYMFIQFAHNDMKKGGAHSDANTEYKHILMEFANAAKEKGAWPVFVTSMNRRSFDENGYIINTLEDYPKAMKEVGKENDIPVIDLNAMSKILYEKLGVEGSKKAFVHYPAGTFPNQDTPLADNTHFNSYGAMQLAKCVLEGMKAKKLELVKYLKPNVAPYDASEPDAFDAFIVPTSPVFNMEKPEGN